MEYIPKYIKAKYIKTMDFTFTDIILLECIDEKNVRNKIKNNEVIAIINDGKIEYINPSYIMYYALYDELVEIGEK